MQTKTLPIRLPQRGEKGVPFIDWLERQLGGDSAARQRMQAFIQEWDHLRDEIQQRELRDPTVEEYAERWNVAGSTAYRLLDEFRSATGIDYPGPLCRLLWDGMPKWSGRGPVPRPKWLLAVEVV
jgi:hypothetical protein